MILYFFIYVPQLKQLEASVPAGRILEVRADTPLSEVVSWAGGGTPLPAPDPSVVVCFVTIPGVGKTALAAALQPVLASASVPASAESVLQSGVQVDGGEGEAGPGRGSKGVQARATAAGSKGRLTVKVSVLDGYGAYTCLVDS